MTFLLYCITLLLIFTNFLMVTFTYEAIAEAYNIGELSYYELFVVITGGFISIINVIWLAVNHGPIQVSLTFVLHVGIFVVNALLIKRFGKISDKHNAKPYQQIKL